MTRLRRSPRALLATSALTLGMLAGSMLATGAQAHITYCRSDPQVFLSNGMKVELTATISTDSSYVDSVKYVLHAPAGTSVTSVVYTGGAFAGKESLSFYADGPANEYDGSTTVNAKQARGVGVTAQEAANYTGASSGAVMTSSSGTTNQTLYTSLRR